MNKENINIINCIHYILLLIVSISITSCRDDFEFEPSHGNELRFSRDTVYLDTIFSNTSSSTYTLKVYNTSNKDIKIPKIQLKKGNDSQFRLSVDGRSGKSFDNIELLAKDSLFVFVESTVDIKNETQNKEFLYIDQLEFQSGNNIQKVELVTLIKDAYFLYPQKITNNSYESIPFNNEELYGFFLDDNDAINGNELHWKNNKPYVVYGYAAIPPQKTLTIDPGTEIHFHDQSGLMVYPDANIQALGTIQNPIIFQGDRLEPSFEDIPGQWDMIFFVQDSRGKISNAIIKNATIGLFINTKSHEIELDNLQIYNCSNYGIVGRAAKINGKNIVTNNIGKSALSLTYGGTYNFNHCTFANFWNRAGHKAVAMDNYDGSLEFSLNVSFKNSILFSSSSESLFLSPSNNGLNFNYQFDHCLIKFNDFSNTYFNKYPYNFDNATKFSNVLISRNNNQHYPFFENVTKNKMKITQNATTLIGFGSITNASLVPQDLLGNSRVNSPDLGAYQHVTITND